MRAKLLLLAVLFIPSVSYCDLRCKPVEIIGDDAIRVVCNDDTGFSVAVSSDEVKIKIQPDGTISQADADVFADFLKTFYEDAKKEENDKKLADEAKKKDTTSEFVIPDAKVKKAPKAIAEEVLPVG